MITYSITIKSNSRTMPKTVTVEAETALDAMKKAKAEDTAYTEVLSCTIVCAR
jgi:hypothetical protein